MFSHRAVQMPSVSILACLSESALEAAQLYQKADSILSTWVAAGAAGDRLVLTADNCKMALRVGAYVQEKHPDLSLTAKQILDVVGILYEDMLDWRDIRTEAGFANVIDECLELAGLLDTPGDCPECGKGGYASAPRHHVCARLILAKARFKCHCGKPATNFSGWAPICLDCEEHKAHLDALCD